MAAPVSAKKKASRVAVKKEAATVAVKQEAASVAVQKKADKFAAKKPGGSYTRLLLRIQLKKARGRRVSAGTALEDWKHLASSSPELAERLLSPGVAKSLYHAQANPKRGQYLQLNTGGKDLASLSTKKVSLHES